MDTLIAFLVAKFGWVALIGGLVIYLVVESILDVASGLIGEWIRDRIDVHAGRTPR